MGRRLAAGPGNQIVIDLPDVQHLGPKMLALTEPMRRFVWALQYFNEGADAARAAGYSPGRAKQTGYDLLHSPKVLDALHEINVRRLSAIAVKAIGGLDKIVSDPQHPKHSWAIDAVLNRTGHAPQTEHKIHVEHSMDELQVKAIAAQMALQLGVDQKKLLGANDPISLEPGEQGLRLREIEVEAVEVGDSSSGT